VLIIVPQLDHKLLVTRPLKCRTQNKQNVASILKTYVAFWLHGWIQTHEIWNYQNHSQLIELMMRRNKKKCDQKVVFRHQDFETLLFNKVYFIFNGYTVCGCFMFISFWSHCDTVIRPRGFTLKIPLVIWFIFLSMCVQECWKKLLEVHNSHCFHSCESFVLSTWLEYNTLKQVCTRTQTISLVVFL